MVGTLVIAGYCPIFPGHGLRQRPGGGYFRIPRCGFNPAGESQKDCTWSERAVSLTAGFPCHGPGGGGGGGSRGSSDLVRTVKEASAGHLVAGQWGWAHFRPTWMRMAGAPGSLPFWRKSKGQLSATYQHPPGSSLCSLSKQPCSFPVDQAGGDRFQRLDFGQEYPRPGGPNLAPSPVLSGTRLPECPGYQASWISSPKNRSRAWTSPWASSQSRASSAVRGRIAEPAQLQPPA